MPPGELDAPTIRSGRALAPPPGGLRPGAELAGRYRILELLGEGGMGVVYRARDLSLELDVALKLLHPRVAGDPDKIAFFRNEVRVARMVTHPNVCRLHDLIESGGSCFITMEHVAGESLAARLARGRLELGDALRVLRDAASGLAAAHAAGVIHRDLKPSNVLLAADRAVVADFGIAGEGRALAAGPQDVAGTRGYMAPEQATGGPLDARVDVYALGVLAFVLATGRRPPPAVTDAASASLTALPSTDRDELPAALAELPAELAALITDCLSVDPADRPRDAGDVLRRLDGIREAEARAARPAEPSASSIGDAGAHSARLPGRSIGQAGRGALIAAACAIAAGAALAITAERAGHGGDPAVEGAAAAPRIALPALDAAGLAERERWLAAVIQHLIGDELVDAWGLDVELDAPAPAPGTHVVRGALARDPSGRLRLALDGAVLEAATPRELALAAAARVVNRHVAEAARHPTAYELAEVGAHDAEAWRLWRRAQRETLLLRWERASALFAAARARDPAFPVAALEAALTYDNKDTAASSRLAEAVALMDRVPVRPLWRLAATAARQLMNEDAAGAARTVEAARRLDLEPRERLWIELRWAMARLFEDAPDAVPALELITERHPGHPAAFKLLASVELGSDAPTAPTLALRHATRAVELAPEDAGARADLAVALLVAGRRDEARARAAELAQLDPEDKRLARSRLFMLHMALGDLAEAELDAHRLLTGTPAQRAEGTSDVALIDLYWGRFERGLAELTASADAFDALGMTVSAVRGRLLAGRQAQLLGDHAAARAAFARVASGATHDAPVAQVLARAAAGELAAARAAAAAIPAGTVERAAADLAIADAAHDAAGVLAAFRRIEQLSTTIESLFAVADALERIGRRDDAAAMFARLAGHPHAWKEPIASGRAWYRLGRLRERAGDRAAARAAFDEVIRRWGDATAQIPEADDARRRAKALGAAPR